MLSRHAGFLAILAAAAVGVAGPAADVSAQLDKPAAPLQDKSPARYTAVALDLEGAGAVPLQLVVNRWASAGEHQRLIKAMFEKNQDDLVDYLLDQPRAGYVRSSTSLGWDLHFAWRTPGEDGGEIVTLMTDRPLSFAEAAGRPRSADYRLTLIELRLKDGQGEGSLSLATKIIADPTNNILVLENFDLQRIRLVQVKQEGRGR
jgi:hypothetical protein